MTRSVTALAALLLAAALSGCGLFKDKDDETKSWTAEQFYNAAKEELDNGAWDAAIKNYEKLEASRAI